MKQPQHVDGKRPSVLVSSTVCGVRFLQRKSRIILRKQATSEERLLRADELAANQSIYVYESPPTIPNVAFIKGPYSKLPGQTPSLRFKIKVALVSIKILANNYRINGKIFEMVRVLSLLFHALSLDLSSPANLDVFANKFSEESKASHEKAFLDLETKFAAAREGSTLFEEKSPILAPYRALYRVLKAPMVANVFLEDRVFARLRVAGYNPMSLFRVHQNTLPFQIPAETVLNLNGDTFEAALKDDRIYALDFQNLSSVAQDPTSEKVLIAAQALFHLPSTDTNLLPIAIRLVSTDEIIMAPTLINMKTRALSRDARWDIAKHALNCCDAIHHELIAHLGKTHLLIEPFVAATMRQLPSCHPIHALLAPHFEGTIFINERASQNLVAPGGDVDRIFAGEISDVMKWCSKQVLNTRFNQCFPDVDLKQRGVDDSRLHFPYRDDALAHFNALLAWVRSYLEYFYKSDEDVVQDEELRAWVDEITALERGRVKDFGDHGNSKIVTLNYLVRAIAFLIFTASVQHAAVNFPQLSLMSYAPALAGALWGPLPSSGQVCDVNTWMTLLPSPKIAMEQIDILGVIGAVYYTRLGHYRKRQFSDTLNSCASWPTPIREAHNRYLKTLKDIDQTIVKRERKHDLKYDYLRPRNIPQSINI